MVFNFSKVILVSLYTFMMLSPWIIPTQTSIASYKMAKETQSNNQTKSQQEKPSWKKVKKEQKPEPKQQPKQQQKPEPKKQSKPDK